MRKLQLSVESHRKFWRSDRTLRYESKILIYLLIVSGMAWKGKKSGDELINEDPQRWCRGYGGHRENLEL